MVNVLADAEHLLLLVTTHCNTTVPAVPLLVKVTLGLAAVVLEKLAPAPPVAEETLHVYGLVPVEATLVVEIVYEEVAPAHTVATAAFAVPAMIDTVGAE